MRKWSNGSILNEINVINKFKFITYNFRTVLFKFFLKARRCPGGPRIMLCPGARAGSRRLNSNLPYAGKWKKRARNEGHKDLVMFAFLPSLKLCMDQWTRFSFVPCPFPPFPATSVMHPFLFAPPPPHVCMLPPFVLLPATIIWMFPLLAWLMNFTNAPFPSLYSSILHLPHPFRLSQCWVTECVLSLLVSMVLILKKRLLFSYRNFKLRFSKLWIPSKMDKSLTRYILLCISSGCFKSLNSHHF